MQVAMHQPSSRAIKSGLDLLAETVRVTESQANAHAHAQLAHVSVHHTHTNMCHRNHNRAHRQDTGGADAEADTAAVTGGAHGTTAHAQPNPQSLSHEALADHNAAHTPAHAREHAHTHSCTHTPDAGQKTVDEESLDGQQLQYMQIRSGDRSASSTDDSVDPQMEQVRLRPNPQPENAKRKKGNRASWPGVVTSPSNASKTSIKVPGYRPARYATC